MYIRTWYQVLRYVKKVKKSRKVPQKIVCSLAIKSKEGLTGETIPLRGLESKYLYFGISKDEGRILTGVYAGTNYLRQRRFVTGNVLFTYSHR